MEQILILSNEDVINILKLYYGKEFTIVSKKDKFILYLNGETKVKKRF